MKNFSYETKSKRRNAVFKVILKRYVCLPLLLYILYFIGQNVCRFINGTYTGILMLDIFTNILAGLMFLFLTTICICLIYVIVYGIISYLKRKTLLQDIKVVFFVIGGIIYGMCEIIVKIPVNFSKRIKDEKGRFQDAVERQLVNDNK